MSEYRQRFLDKVAKAGKIDISFIKMKELLDHYQGIKRVKRDCPLCNVYRLYSCSYCPYNLDKTDCGDLALDMCKTLEIHKLREFYENYPEWTKKRIRDLKRWIKIYTEYKEKFIKK